MSKNKWIIAAIVFVVGVVVGLYIRSSQHNKKVLCKDSYADLEGFDNYGL